MKMHAETRLYASAIAVVSGLYSILLPRVGEMGSMPLSDAVMLGVGVVVLVHGLVLLTPAAERLGRGSGWLMVLWSALMLGNQGLAAMPAASAMGVRVWDPGMVAIALLMLASGLIMRRYP